MADDNLRVGYKTAGADATQRSHIAAVSIAQQAARPQAAGPAAPHNVVRGDTVGSIARQHGVSEERLIAVNPQLRHGVAAYLQGPPIGSLLAIPQTEADDEPSPSINRATVAETIANIAAPTGASPIDRAAARARESERDLILLKNTAAAGKDYAKAGLREQEGTVRDARAQLRAEIDAELQTKVQRPTGDIVDTSTIREQGAAIAGRYADTATKAGVQREVDGLAYDTARSTVLSAGTPQAIGRALAEQTSKLLPSQRDSLLQDPLLTSAIAGDFAGTAPGAIIDDAGQCRAAASADAFAHRLAEIASQLPPDLAAELTGTMMPQIAAVGHPKFISPLTGGPDQRFVDLSRVVNALGTGPQAAALTGQIADAYRPALETGATRGTTMQEAVTNGGDATLALAIADRLRASGDNPAAITDITNGIQGGLGDLQRGAAAAVSDYNKFMAGSVMPAIAAARGLPNADQAAQRYIESQPPAFRQRYEQLVAAMDANGLKLHRTLQQVGAAPSAIRSEGGLDDALNAIASDPHSMGAIHLAATKHPEAFVGVAGENALHAFDIVKMSKEGSEGLRSLASLTIGANHAAAIDVAGHGGPSAVSKARAMLGRYGDASWAVRLGLDPKTYHELDRALDNVVAADGPAAVRRHMDELTGILREGSTNLLDAGPAGRMFRSLNVVAGVTLAHKSLDDVLDEDDMSNRAGLIGDLAGLAKDAGEIGNRAMGNIVGETGMKAFGATMGLLSVAGDTVKAANTDNGFDRGTSIASATAAGLMLAGTLASGPVGWTAAGLGATFTVVTETIKGNHATAEQTAKFTEASRALLSDPAFGLTPAAIAQLEQRGGDAGQFSGTGVLTDFLAGRGYRPEAIRDWINEAARNGKLEPVMNVALEVASHPDNVEVPKSYAGFNSGSITTSITDPVQINAIGARRVAAAVDAAGVYSSPPQLGSLADIVAN